METFFDELQHPLVLLELLEDSPLVRDDPLEELDEDEECGDDVGESLELVEVDLEDVHVDAEEGDVEEGEEEGEGQDSPDALVVTIVELHGHTVLSEVGVAGQPHGHQQTAQEHRVGQGGVGGQDREGDHVVDHHDQVVQGLLLVADRLERVPFPRGRQSQVVVQ